jgi:hypothetical protein
MEQAREIKLGKQGVRFILTRGIYLGVSVKLVTPIYTNTVKERSTVHGSKWFVCSNSIQKDFFI